MTWHDAYTNGTSRVLIVASLRPLKMEALILAPTDCEVRSVIKFLNLQRITPIEIHRHQCQQSFCAISRSLLHKIVTEHLFRKLCARWVPKQLTPEHKEKSMESALTIVVPVFLHLKEFLSSQCFSEWQWRGDECCTVDQSQVADFYNTGNSWTLAVSVTINLSIKLGFYFVNCPSKT